MLQELLAQNPGLEVTPQILLGFIAEKTKSTNSAHDEERGREEYRRDAGFEHSRSLSSDSDGTSYYPGTRSRPPSRGPMTPSTKSPLDSERRQRSTPLSTGPPSSWTKRPTPAGRRKSDAGSRSDGEVSCMCLHMPETRSLTYILEWNTCMGPQLFPATYTFTPCVTCNAITRSLFLSWFSTRPLQAHVPPLLSQHTSAWGWKRLQQFLFFRPGLLFSRRHKSHCEDSITLWIQQL